MLGELIALFGNKGARVVSSRDGMGDAFGPGSCLRSSRFASRWLRHCDPYRKEFGDVPRNPFNRGE